ncbi:hypothetical protein B5X24_HaOG208475 [Helicoverpa armigera]|uniref:THAP-type domain-containing protein n=1 Tax=Helicoverpa armigera TaxID=29058 RepID=A0A2W1BM87_HELAM|nr:hypothetical protein B5X24_HaOG208475 [Helicoverpa armigera]
MCIKKSTSGQLCAVHGCRTSKRNNKLNLSFFSLPKEEDRRKKWTELIGRPDLDTSKAKTTFLCSLHFDPSVIINIPKLHPDALPSRCLPSEAQKEDLHPEPGTASYNCTLMKRPTQEASTQTEYSTAETLKAPAAQSESEKTTATVSTNTPRKRKLKIRSKQLTPKKKKTQE